MNCTYFPISLLNSTLIRNAAVITLNKYFYLKKIARYYYLSDCGIEKKIKIIFRKDRVFSRMFFAQNIVINDLLAHLHSVLNYK